MRKDLEIGNVRVVENETNHLTTIVLYNDKGIKVGAATLSIEKGYEIEKRFENTVKLLIKKG